MPWNVQLCMPVVFSLPHRLQVVLDSTMEANLNTDNTLDSIVEV